jgi:hypothetical protein
LLFRYDTGWKWLVRGGPFSSLEAKSGLDTKNRRFSILMRGTLETALALATEHHTSNPKDFANNGIAERFDRTMKKQRCT